MPTSVFAGLHSRQINTKEDMFWQCNGEGRLFVSGYAYDYATRLQVVEAWACAKDAFATQQPGAKPPSKSQVARDVGVGRFFAGKIIDWYESGQPLVDRPRGGAFNAVLDDIDLDYLAFLVDSQTCYCDRDYCTRLNMDLGCAAEERTVRAALVDHRLCHLLRLLQPNYHKPND